ncbi:hypothetical protein [Rhodobacter capsulatus]|uniref:hypothetical protein n=1 Tax=Rhodobacter capsulatus TaxID=1061 RepID=UPI004025528E
MLNLPPQTIHAMGFISACRAEWKLWSQLLQNANKIPIAPLHIDYQTCALFLHHCEVLEGAAKLLRLKASESAARRAFDEGMTLLSQPIGYDAHRLSRVVNLAEQLIQVFGDEIRGGPLLTLDSRHAAFFDMSEPFGKSVADSFPSAEFDISEAAKCRAVGRWTACVMHMMRALEVGLAALARHYDVEVDNNWNKTLNEIEAKTREIGKRSHGAGAEQWAAEAATHLRFVKNAWRNQAMHPRQTYDEERAVVIFDNARSFMQHLSERLSEDDAVI